MFRFLKRGGGEDAGAKQRAEQQRQENGYQQLVELATRVQNEMEEARAAGFGSIESYRRYRAAEDHRFSEEWVD